MLGNMTVIDEPDLNGKSISTKRVKFTEIFTDPAYFFCTENVACLKHLLHIFKCITEYFYSRIKHYEP